MADRSSEQRGIWARMASRLSQLAAAVSHFLAAGSHVLFKDLIKESFVVDFFFC